VALKSASQMCSNQMRLFPVMCRLRQAMRTTRKKRRTGLVRMRGTGKEMGVRTEHAFDERGCGYGLRFGTGLFDVLGIFWGELERLAIKKRTELTGSGRGRTVLVVVSDRKATCDEPDHHEANYGGERNFKPFLLVGRREDHTGPDELGEHPSFRTMLVLDGCKEP